MAPYLVIGLLALGITFVATPAVRWTSLRIGAVDVPNDRKVHACPTPTLGGGAIFVGILGAGTGAFFLNDLRSVFTQSSEWLGIIVGGAVIFALGTIDDLRDLPAPVKLSGQIFAAGICFLAGVQMQYILIPGGVLVLDPNLSAVVTVVWLVAMMNAINLVDGLDGLAAGIVAIASAAFFVYSFQLGTQVYSPAPTAPLVAIVLVGSTLGFLRHNFHPARIFMGDSGAMLLGLVLGAATVSGVGKPAYALPPGSIFLAYFPLVIPVLVIAIPLLDALLAIVRRARARRNVFHADKAHIHHRLMDLGHGHRQAVVVMYVWSALAAGAGLAFTFLQRADLLFAFPVAVGAIVLYTLFPVLTKAINGRMGNR